MMKRIALLALPLCLVATAPSATAQDAPPPLAAQPVRVAMETELGTITLEVDPGRAPVTAGNFPRDVDQKGPDGVVFYRGMRLDWGPPPTGPVPNATCRRSPMSRPV